MPIGDDKQKKIAEYLYESDFDFKGRGRRRGQRHKTMTNDIKKIKLEQTDLKKIQNAIRVLNKSNFNNVEDYKKSGKTIFNSIKLILMSDKYQNKKSEQIHAFFHNLEADVHQLMSVKNIEEGENYRKRLLKKLEQYKNYFE